MLGDVFANSTQLSCRRLHARAGRVVSSRYQLLLTEISARNPRSLRAHARVGVRELTRYQDETDAWIIVGWDLSRS